MQHTTNYYNTFIEVADDTKAVCGTLPKPKKSGKTIAEMQYTLLAKHPYRFTSDDVFFQIYAERNDLLATEHDQAREVFFSKGQPCFRSSPLPKTYGFGVHADPDGKVAIVGMETERYAELLNDASVKKVKAMRSGKR